MLISAENPYIFDIEADTYLYASFSETTTVVDDSDAPAEVADFSISHIGGGVAVMDWTDPADSDFDHVEIFVSPAESPAVTSTTSVRDGMESATLTDLISETFYNVTLKTVDTVGNTSSSISFTVYMPATFTAVSSFLTNSDGAALNSTLTSDLAGYYILAVDVDLNSVSWTPVGSDSTPFTGIFDGGGRSISNLTINASGSDNYQGFFGYNSGKLINICLTESSVIGSGYVGALAGNNSGGIIIDCNIAGYATGTSNIGGLAGANTGTITNCSFSGNVSGTTNNIGGLIEYNAGQVFSSHSTGTIAAYEHVGGLIGKNDNAVYNSYATGSVSVADNYAGGLTGENYGGIIINCYATGAVSGEGYYYEGLAGKNSGSVTNSYSTRSVTGTSYAGGFVGENNGGTVTDCCATGNVSGQNIFNGLSGLQTSYAVGGLAGNNTGVIMNCYSAGSVSGYNSLGALLGNNPSVATVSNCYADSSVNSSLSIIGTNSGTFTGSMLSTAQMQSSGFYGSSWDFVNTWAISSSVNSGYPYLRELVDSY